jgi:predicted O-methyltransferase YrrM
MNIDPTITVGNIIEIGTIFGGGALFLWRMHKANRDRLEEIARSMRANLEDCSSLHRRLDVIEKSIRDNRDEEEARLNHLDDCVDSVKQAVSKVQNAFDLVWEWFKEGSYYRKKDQ